MAIRIPRSDETILALRKDLVIQSKVNYFIKKKSNGRAQGDKYTLYTVDKDWCYVPLEYGMEKFGAEPRNDHPRVTGWKATTPYREEQPELVDELVNRLNQHRSVMVACKCGFGKTYVSISIAAALGLHALVIMYAEESKKEWAKETKSNTSMNAEIITARSPRLNLDVPVHITGFETAIKLGREFFKDIGVLIVDECPFMLTKTRYKAPLLVEPQYTMFLSATPVRDDGLDVAFPLFVHYPPVWRNIHHPLLFIQVKTGINPNIIIGADGYPMWGVALDSLAENKDRNLFIALISSYLMSVGLKVLVATKRLEHAAVLVELIHEQSPSSVVSEWHSGVKKANYASDCIVATTGKVNVGFNWKEADVIINALDSATKTDSIANVEQLFGRVTRRPGVLGIIVDLVDNYKSFERHSEIRARWIRKASTYGNDAVITVR